MPKSLEEIWNEMEQKRLLEKQIAEQQDQALYEQREKARQEYLKTMRMYEAASSANSAAGAGGAGGSKKHYFITIDTTMWLYPIVDVEAGLAGTTYSYTRVDNTITCTTMEDLVAVYLSIVYQSLESQPVGNQGYSMGAGTILLDLKNEFYFKLNDELIVKWRYVKQITNQRDLPPDNIGNSPDGTIGYVTTFEDWPRPFPNEYLDFSNVIDYVY